MTNLITTASHRCNGLTHWGRATHIRVSKVTIIASDNGLSPGRRQAIVWNNAEILSIGLLGTNVSEILIEILAFSFKKMHLKVSSAKYRPFCLGFNVLMHWLVTLTSQLENFGKVLWLTSSSWHYVIILHNAPNQRPRLSNAVYRYVVIFPVRWGVDWKNANKEHI